MAMWVNVTRIARMNKNKNKSKIKRRKNEIKVVRSAKSVKCQTVIAINVMKIRVVSNNNSSKKTAHKQVIITTEMRISTTEVSKTIAMGMRRWSATSEIEKAIQIKMTMTIPMKQITKKKRIMMMKDMSLEALTKMMLKMRASVTPLKTSKTPIIHNNNRNNKNRKQSVSRVVDSNCKTKAASRTITTITTRKKMHNVVVMSDCSVIHHMHHIHTSSKDSSNSSNKMHNTIRIKPSKRQWNGMSEISVVTYRNNWTCNNIYTSKRTRTIRTIRRLKTGKTLSIIHRSRNSRSEYVKHGNSRTVRICITMIIKINKTNKKTMMKVNWQSLSLTNVVLRKA